MVFSLAEIQLETVYGKKKSKLICGGLTLSSASHSSSGHSHLSKQWPDIVQRSSPLDWSKTNSRQASSQTEIRRNQNISGMI
jgi:hypothetical protein